MARTVRRTRSARERFRLRGRRRLPPEEAGRDPFWGGRGRSPPLWEDGLPALPCCRLLRELEDE